MSRATLAIILSKLKPFPAPKTSLEQYPTPSEAAATILWDAHTKGLITSKHVLDLGAGTGILGIGAMALGAKKVTFIDIDESLRTIIEANIATMKREANTSTGEYDIRVQDITATTTTADLVISNPPFGTKEKHTDTNFLEKAYQLAPECYTFHKSSTDAYLRQWFNQQQIRIIQPFPFTFSLPSTMQHHEKRAHHVAITCWHTRKDL
ncbi:RsmD family RNA methyltransferase [Candidatus Woesearchaeota archaeon]|nr:RsmD family RNA methyltransferase [Candidatus Woesearchaeota archaeon]